MTYKAYIIANKQQEREVLEKLEREAVTWWYSLKPASQFIPSKYSSFPYGLKILDSYVVFAYPAGLENYEIVYDGRKEERMSDKYVVSQEFMDDLKVWKAHIVATNFINGTGINHLPSNAHAWLGDDVPDNEKNNRLIAIIRWVNGEDVFDVKTNKWIVRSKETDEDGDYHYVNLDNFKNLRSVSTIYGLDFATKFDTKEEAQEWANSHQEVIEVKE